MVCRHLTYSESFLLPTLQEARDSETVSLKHMLLEARNTETRLRLVYFPYTFSFSIFPESSNYN